MRIILLIAILSLQFSPIKAQVKVKMNKVDGVCTMPCVVNGLKLSFIFDTGASNVCISMSEALFMLKNGYMSKNDIKGSSYSQIANGNIVENTTATLRKVEIAGITLHNVEAVIIHELTAPLLLGNSAINKLGKIQINDDELIILDAKSSQSEPTTISSKLSTTRKREPFTKEDFKKYKTLSKQGDSYAQNNLGLMYRLGEGVLQDSKQAIFWWQKAAKHGNINSQYNLGELFYYGDGVLPNHKQAIHWYLKAAEQGHIDAQYNLGLIFDNEKSNLFDLKQAIFWHKKAAIQGDADSQCQLGLSYSQGKGVLKDIKKAKFWYKKAAEQEHAHAQYLLGLEFLIESFNKDSILNKKQAAFWIKKAYDNGLDKASKTWAENELWKYSE